MIISVDLDAMYGMAALAESTNDEAAKCEALSAKITEHSDWNCAERDVINDGIIAIKTKVRRLYETVEEFSRSLRQSAEAFKEAEDSYIRQIENLDCAVGSALSTVPASGSPSPAVGEISSAMRENADLPHGVGSYDLGSAGEPIQICEFGDINLGGGN